MADRIGCPASPASALALPLLLSFHSLMLPLPFFQSLKQANAFHSLKPLNRCNRDHPLEVEADVREKERRKEREPLLRQSYDARTHEAQSGFVTDSERGKRLLLTSDSLHHRHHDDRRLTGCLLPQHLSHVVFSFLLLLSLTVSLRREVASPLLTLLLLRLIGSDS